ncbi:MAG TPA: PQQ-binding-like beta-propeller repeat protein [Candidatus Sulfotelmatobacter sp.]|nr:PQQ-binding-like beta-propeller repeat protein [Candidatus Sulfotelmatobacter sp.]
MQLTPSSLKLQPSAQQQFIVTVAGSNNVNVTWSVDSSGAGNSSTGTITGTGLYIAPRLSGTHNVTATSVADTTKSATAIVTVQGTVSISPATVGLNLGATQQFSVTVQGQSNPVVTWSVDGISGGNSSVGTINAQGLYTAASQIGTHTIAADVASAGSGAAASVTVLSLSISPDGALMAPGATQQFSASIQGVANTGVTWSVDGTAGGNTSVGTISASGLYTAPNAIGGHTIAVSSVAYPSVNASSNLMIQNTAPGAVLTYHNDDAREGAFTQETTLTPSVVNSSQFGKLRSYPVDGQIYTQPLYVPQLGIAGAAHNVVFVGTENNTVYAFDADGLQSPPLWSRNLGSPSPRNDSEGISPVLGITGTPVIDITTGTLYVVTITISGPFYLHALDITSGAEKFGGPVQITGSVPGTGWDNNNGTIQIETGCYQRTGLALNPVSNEIYIGFGHCNHGWLLAYDKTSLQQKAIFNDTPDGAGGGLWNSGGAPVIDDQTGKVFIMTGVDQNDPPSGYNDSFLRLSPDVLSVEDFFQPDNAAYLAVNDADLGSGSPVLMPDNPSSTPHEVIGGGKDGNIFVVNRDNMGSFSPTSNNVIQTVQTGVHQFDNIFATPAYWNGLVYIHCESDVLRAFSWNNGQLSNQPVTKGQPVLSVHGATVSISSNGSNNGIVWEIDNTNHDTGGPAILRAYDALNISNELYDSTQAGSRDTAGSALKFTVPTVAAGKVFVGTTNELDVYGLLGK